MTIPPFLFASPQSAAREPDRCVVIDTTEPRVKVAMEIWTIVSQRLDPAMAPVELAGAAS